MNIIFKDSGDYPLIAAGAYFRKFRSSFCDFVQALVRQCQYEIIYDQYMMDNILTLLTELSNSQVRAFRHTSTLAAMKLMTGLVNVALQLSVSLDNTQRQYDAEHSKSLSKRASEKLDILMQKKKELEEQQSEIEGMLNGIFKGIFVHRYRDFIAEIRALCMDEIGAWMKMFPKVFLTDSYLKYVGWTLHDKQKEVRAKCLNSLIGLYGDNEMTRDLKLFTSRFKDRIVSMTLDKEYDVAVQAIKLLHLILSNCGYDTPVLTSSDSERVYQLVFSCHRPVAVAAADFLNKQLFINKEVNPGYTKRGKRRGVNAPLITDLVLFFIESELHEHATYLVDSLWDVASVMLKDWECMSDMLLEEPANERDALDEKQESALVDIMVCSVKQAAEGVPPTGRQGYSKKTASRDRKMAIEDRLRLTEHFMVALPNLLKKFHVDREKVVGLLQIPRYFELECYTTSRREKHLDDLLAQLSVIVDKHTDPDVLEQVSRTYSHLCDDEFAIFNKVSISRRAVIDKWAENFRFALAIFKDAEDNVDEEEIYNVVQNLKRLTHLYMFNDLTQWDLYPKANSIIEMHQERPDTIPQAMLLQTVKFIYYHLLYSLAGLKNGGTSSGAGAEDPRAAIAQLRKRVGEYLRACELLLASSPHKKIQEESYMSICDLLVIFAPQLAHSSPNLKSLVQRPSEPVQHSLVDFVREFVFTLPDEDDSEDDTAKIDALHQRRSLLAAICKLFVYSLIDLRLAAVVFQQYIRFYSDYGDIIKETISKTRHVNKLACAQTLALSLKTLFRDTVREQGGVLDQSSQEYGHMKELARRFALTFGLDQVKTRDAVAELHREGIVFALKRDESMFNEAEPPANLTFLGILVEFSAKLMKQDKRTVLQYLDKHISPHQLSNQESLWIPLVTYRNSLLQGAGMDDDARPTAGKGRRGRRKKNMDGDFDAPPTPISPATPMHQPPTPMTPQMQPPMTPQAPMTPQPPMTPQNVMGQPQLSSTVMRGDQMRIQEDHMMEYQPFTLKDWLSGADSKATRGRVSRRERQALYDSGGTTLLKSPSKPPKPKTPSKKSKKDGPDKKAGLKQIEKNIGRKKSSVDPVSGKMMGPPEQGSASSRRRSSRSRDRQVLSYTEDSDEESDEDSDDVFQEEQPQRSSGSKKKRNKKLFEEEISIDDFDETKESTEDPLSHVEEKTSSISLKGREESTDQETSTANSTPQFKSSEIKESNKSLTEDLFLPLASDEEKDDGEDELFEFSPPAAPKLTQQSSLAGSENPFLKIVNSVKQKSDMRSSQSFEEDHISDASSSDDSTEDTPQPNPVVRSKPLKIDKFSGSSDDESSEESDDSKEEEIKPERRRKEKQHSIDDSDEGGFGAFDDLVHSILQSSQESSQSDRQQTIINTPMQMNPGQNHPIPQEYHQMGYTMPQPSPIPQMGTPQHAPPQYMHPGTPSGMYQQNSGADFQTVMSPMTQPGMQSQPQYYGN